MPLPNDIMEDTPRGQVYTFKLLTRQKAALQDIQRQTGATVAELIRRSIDLYLERHHAQQKWRGK